METQMGNIEQILTEVRYLVSRLRMSIGNAIDSSTYCEKDSTEYQRAMGYIVGASFKLGETATAGQILDKAISEAHSDNA